MISRLYKWLFSSQRTDSTPARNIDEIVRISNKGQVYSSPTVEIIDENTKGNVLSNKSRLFSLYPSCDMSVFSTEGFAENSEKQTELANFLIGRFGVKQRGALLDVGFGTNLHVAKTFVSKGIKASAIDSIKNDKKNPAVTGVEIVTGDISDISGPSSKLRSNKFGLILFNGSWISGGNNFTVGGEVMEAKYHELKSKSQSCVQFIDEERDRIVGACKDHLTSVGLIGVISSRYAYHGAGWNFDKLPEEKLSFVDLYERFMRLGAKKIYLVGLSQKGFDELLNESKAHFKIPERRSLVNPDDLPEVLSEEEIRGIRRGLTNIENLPREDVYTNFGDNTEYQRKRIKNVLEATKDIPELREPARIDAIFAEF